jgi:cytochrome P450
MRLFTPDHSPSNTPEVRALPGPARPWFGWLLGNMAQLADHRETLIHPDWFQWGWTGIYESLFAQKRIYTFDPVAIGYIFAHPDEFERPRDLRTILGHIMGAASLVTTEGDQHRRLRRALNPAFSAGSIRAMQPAIFEKAGELVRLFERLIDDDGLEGYAGHPPAPEDRVPGARKIDVFKFAGSLTTDVIGVAGFEHDFNSLSPEDDSPELLANRFNNLVDAANGMALLTEAQNILPVLDKIVRHRET